MFSNFIIPAVSAQGICGNGLTPIAVVTVVQSIGFTLAILVFINTS